MLKLIIDNVILAIGVVALSYGAYNLIRQPKGQNYSSWFLAGLATVLIVILHHTLFIDLSLAGYKQSVFYLKYLTDGIMIFLWVYVAYKEGFFGK